MSANQNLSEIITLRLADDKVAIIDAVHNKKISYYELERYSNRIANWLISLGIKKEKRIAICGYNSINYISLFFALCKIGAIAVLINRKSPDEKIEYILKDSRSTAIFSDRDLSTDIPIINLKRFEVFSFDINFKHCIVDDDLAFIIYTSGSTGNPKGVCISHKRHRWLIEKKSQGTKADLSRTLIAAPFCHMNGLSNIEVSIASKATAVIIPEFQQEHFIDAIEKYKVNQISGVPTMLSLISDNSLINDINTSAVKHIMMGSAPVTRSLFNKLKEKFPQAFITISYGLSEVGPSLFGRHPDNIPTPELSVGYPIKEIEYRLYNGILEIKSPSVMLGYNNIEKNKFTEDGFYITNDLFEIDDQGFYFFKGRADDMFVSGGNNIFPRNIETILEENDSVFQSAVVPVLDLYKGYKPYVFLVVKKESQYLESEFKEYYRQKLFPYEYPRKIWIIEQMPLNEVGKIDKKKLQQMAEQMLN